MTFSDRDGNKYLVKVKSYNILKTSRVGNIDLCYCVVNVQQDSCHDCYILKAKKCDSYLFKILVTNSLHALGAIPTKHKIDTLGPKSQTQCP